MYADVVCGQVMSFEPKDSFYPTFAALDDSATPATDQSAAPNTGYG